ncbi:MAG: protein-L-isoaspartate(D-aspartate) O-methyltransferase [Anaerolineae bacterium]
MRQNRHHELELRDVCDPLVLRAMHKVPRAEFVPEPYRQQAYGDYPLPIGHGQTISQPYIVGLMTQLLELRGGEKVLEIGTGSAYQAAVLAEIAAEVYSIEIIPELAASAVERLARLGYSNVHVRLGDGNEGWPEQAPYDAIIITAAAPAIPPALLSQLKDGGVLVAPVGRASSLQVLQRLRKSDDNLECEEICTVAFVPLVRGKSKRG